MADLAAYLARLGFVGFELLADDREVGFVRGETQHDQIGVGPTQTVLRVRVVVGLRTLTSNVVHDLVLTCMKPRVIARISFK